MVDENEQSPEARDSLTHAVIGAAIEVHKHLVRDCSNPRTKNASAWSFKCLASPSGARSLCR
ncbi:MAG: hypothetical protein CHACPFDD_00663 [Phycisphaerae bacterium]|nr:hypothetical protein [Phycisphaerae bacterium]